MTRNSCVASCSSPAALSALGSSGRRGRRGDDRMAARDRRERVMLLARDLRRIGTAPALQFEMVADRVLEVAHADSLTRLRTL